MTNENKQLEEPKEIKSLNWIDKSKFKAKIKFSYYWQQRILIQK